MKTQYGHIFHTPGVSTENQVNTKVMTGSGGQGKEQISSCGTRGEAAGSLSPSEHSFAGLRSLCAHGLSCVHLRDTARHEKCLLRSQT